MIRQTRARKVGRTFVCLLVEKLWQAAQVQIRSSMLGSPVASLFRQSD